MLHSRGYCSLVAEISTFVKKKTQVFESYEAINFCKNEVMRKQTLEQASFFKGEFHQVSGATRNSDA